MLNFAGLPIERLRKSEVSWDNVQHIIDWILEDTYWFLDEDVLYIVSKRDDVYGPDTEMRDAMQALLDCEEYNFHCGDLDEHLRLGPVPTCYRYFDREHGFYVVFT